MKFFQIGDRLINADHITHATYTHDQGEPQLVVSFVGCEDCQIFYGSEAEQLWARLSHLSLKLLPPEKLASLA